MNDPTVRARVHDLDLRRRLEEQLCDRLEFIKDQYIKHRTSWDVITKMLTLKGEQPHGVDEALTSERLRAFCRRAGRNRDGWADPVGIGKGRQKKEASNLKPRPSAISSNASEPLPLPLVPDPSVPEGTTREIESPQSPGSPENEHDVAIDSSKQSISEELETLKRNRVLAMVERRAMRDELQKKHYDDWKRHVWDLDFDFNLDGSRRDHHNAKTCITDNSWFDLP